MVKVKPVHLGKTTRRSFSQINEVIEMPNLIGIQMDSYKWFLKEGIAEVLRDISPITDANGKYELSFISHHLEDNKVHYRGVQGAQRDIRRAAEGHSPPAQP